MSDPKVKGFVKWFSDTKGYGFINGAGEDYFAHYSDIIGDGHKKLEPYQEVEFLPGKNAKGLRAREITPI